MNRAKACGTLAVVLIYLHLAAAAQTTRPEVPAAAGVMEDRIVPLEAVVNGERLGGWPFVERQGALYVGADAIHEWRLRMPADIRPIRVRGIDFYPLAAFAGYSARVNYTTLVADLTFSPDAFTGTRVLLERERQRAKPSPSLPALILNYDLNLQHSTARSAPAVTELGALLEVGASNDWGVVTSTFTGRDLTGGASKQASRWLRLESTATRHLPERNLTLRLGDSATRAGLWGRNVYFGGLQLGSNYELTPGFITQPVPLLSGVSAAPSTVELYVNDLLHRTSQVPTGPFVIDNNVGLTGSGEVRLVVRDVLGREVVVVQRFFTNAQLLAPGLNDWSIDTGWVRENLGRLSSHYGHRFTSGTWRRGIIPGLTLEGRGEWSRPQQSLGVGAVTTLGDFLVRGAVARSQHERLGGGAFSLFGLERQWTQAALTLQAHGATRSFRELGSTELQLPIKSQLAANYSYQAGSTSMGLGLAGIQRYNGDAVTTASLHYGYRFQTATLSASLTKIWGPTPGTSFALSLQVPLEAQRFATAAVNSHGSAVNVYATAAKFPIEMGDIGWRVLGGRVNREARAEAGLDYSGSRGRIYSDLSASASHQSLRLGASGGLALAANRLFLSRRLAESFAVVELKGYPGVGVGLGSNIFASTDESGIAFLPYLSPYQDNQVRLNAQDLPISAELDSIEQIVVPSWRSAVKVDFPIRSGKAALVKIQLANGEPAPAGSVVTLKGRSEPSFVGRRGEAFVTGLQSTNELAMRWAGGRCRFSLRLPEAANDDVLRLGPVTCRSDP